MAFPNRKPTAERRCHAVLIPLTPAQRRRVENAARARNCSYAALGRLALDHFLQNETPPGKERRIVLQEGRDASAPTSKVR